MHAQRGGGAIFGAFVVNRFLERAVESNSLGMFYRALLRAAQIQPFNRGPIRRRLMRFFKKRISHPIRTTFHGVPFVFNLDNPTEQKALFGFYNNQEVDYLVGVAKSGAPVFVDVGANSGFYSQIFCFMPPAVRACFPLSPTRKCARASSRM